MSLGPLMKFKDEDGVIRDVSPDYPFPTTFAIGSEMPVDVAKVGGVEVDNSEPAATTPGPTTTIGTGQVALTSASAQILAANSNRRRGYIVATVDWFVGFTTAVTASTGKKVYAGQDFDLHGHVGAVWGILASGTGTSSYIEFTD